MNKIIKCKNCNKIFKKPEAATNHCDRDWEYCEECDEVASKNN